LAALEQRRLAAIVAADVVGYSRLMGRDESGTLARLREHRTQRLDAFHFLPPERQRRHRHRVYAHRLAIAVAAIAAMGCVGTKINGVLSNVVSVMK
jgi:hypothetical protein